MRSTTLHQSFLTLAVSLLCIGSFSTSAKAENEIEPDLIEMAPFIVYGGIIDTIDGFTGKEYSGNNPVVLDFRSEFNEILLNYHRELLHQEVNSILNEIRVARGMAKDIAEVMGILGLEGFNYNESKFMVREKIITKRLMEDPFFIIEKLVVWDLDQLQHYKDELPESEYAKDIRYNPELNKWERRVTTEWEVHYFGGKQWVKVIKKQGLNLDTNEGYHFINRGLGNLRGPGDFKDVKLTYPIFFDSTEPAAEQVQRLKETFRQNLASIYDPYSWALRRNLRFEQNFRWSVGGLVNRSGKALNVSDRDWMVQVISQLIRDVATVRNRGINYLYEKAMIARVPANGNMLGNNLDLLNWKRGENRSVNYDPKKSLGPNTNFEAPNGARFILLDAYRRYGDGFLNALGQRLKTQEKRIPAKQLIREVLEQVSGVPGDKYIELAGKAQREELNKFKVKL